MFNVALILLIIFSSGILIIKGFQTQLVLVGSGLLLLSVAVMTGDSQTLPAEIKNQGQVWQVIPWFLKKIFSSRLFDIALVVMSVGGYAKYMTHTGAAAAIVKMTTRPLVKLNSPYLTLSLTYLTGQLLNLFIPSAAGLAMLLLMALYPTLLQIGISPSSAAAVIGTTACLDLGPLSGTTIVAASTADLPVTTYFFFHQCPIAIFAAVTIAALHYPVQKYFDSREEKPLSQDQVVSPRAKADTVTVPIAYALLPVLPLLLLVIFSDLVFPGLRVHVVTAVLISLVTVLIVEYVRKKNIINAVRGLQSFLMGMRTMFRTVVTLILAAEVFASGLWATGILHSMIQSVQLLGHAPFVVTLVLIAITGLFAFLSGSGNVAFISFSSLVHKAAPNLALQTVSMVLPMQLAAGLFRSISPVAGVIIAVAGAAGVNPFEIVKRTALPMAGGLIVLLLSSYLYY